MYFNISKYTNYIFKIYTLFIIFFGILINIKISLLYKFCIK